MIYTQKSEIYGEKTNERESEFRFNVITLFVTTIIILLFSVYAYTCDAGAAPLCMASFLFDDYEEKNGIIYAWGQEPVLQLSGNFSGEYYVEIEDMLSGEKSKHLISENKEMEFCEGKYKVEVYELKKGEKDAISGFPITFLYDNSSPFDVAFEIEKTGKGRISNVRRDYQLFTNKPVKVRAKAMDALSGVEAVRWTLEGKSVEASELVVSGVIKDLKAVAIDGCGNESCEYSCDTKIMVDEKNPQINVEEEIEEEEIEFTIELEDGLSGIYEYHVSLNDEILLSDNYRENSTGIFSKDIELKIDKSELDKKNNKLEIWTSDFAGNCMIKRVVLQQEDDIAPVIELSGINNGAVVNRVVSISASVYDENILPENISIVAAHKGIEGTESEYSFRPGDNISFGADGQYTLTAKAQDEFGNAAQQTVEFVIDRCAPLIQGFDELQGAVLKKFTLGENVEERFRDATVVQAEFYLNGRNYDPREEVSTPGEYNLEIYAEDQMGHTSERRIQFCIEGNLEEEKVLATYSVITSLDGGKNEKKGMKKMEKTSLGSSVALPVAYGENIQEGEAKREKNKGLTGVICFVALGIIAGIAIVLAKKKRG